MISSANSVHLSILCIICYRQRESIVTCEIVVIPMNSRSIVLTCIKSLLSFNHCICTFDLFSHVLSLNRDFAPCWHAFDMSNKYYLLTYLPCVDNSYQQNSFNCPYLGMKKIPYLHLDVHHLQKLTVCHQSHVTPMQKISWKFIDKFLIYSTNKQPYDATNPPIWHTSIDAVIDQFATTAARRLNFLIWTNTYTSVHRTVQ